MGYDDWGGSRHEGEAAEERAPTAQEWRTARLARGGGRARRGGRLQFEGAHVQFVFPQPVIPRFIAIDC